MNKSEIINKFQDQPLWEWIAADSFEHEDEHAEQIRAWRERKQI